MEDIFDVYITKGNLNTNFFLTINVDGLNNLGKSQHAILKISDKNMTLVGDNGKDIVSLTPNQIDSIEDNLSAITLKSKEGSLTLNFNNVRKGGIMMMLVGPMLAASSKNSPQSAYVQNKCKDAIASLIKHGYKASYSSKRS